MCKSLPPPLHVTPHTHTHTHTCTHHTHTHQHIVHMHTYMHTCTHTHICLKSQGTGSPIFPQLSLSSPGHRSPSPSCQGLGTLTGHHSEGREVLSSEQRCRKLPDKPFEQIGCIIVANLVPAKQARVEISLQLLFQPLKEGGALMRSWPKAPGKVALPPLWASVSPSAKWGQ